MRGMFFRSDTRHPTNNPSNMFQNGFYKRDVNINDPVLRFPLGRRNAPDIVPESAVCVTRDFYAAPLFPVDDLNTNSWIYFLYLDTSNMTNTLQSQYSHVSRIGNLGGNDALWPLFGQERAVNAIEPADIAGAVEVRRRFNGSDVFNGGDFECLNYVANPGYGGPAAHLNAIRDLLASKIGTGLWLRMPTQAQGIVQSTGT